MATPLRTLRERLGISQGQMATDLGVVLSTIQGWEKKKNRPQKLYVAMLAEYFDVPPDELDLKPNVVTHRYLRQQEAAAQS